MAQTTTAVDSTTAIVGISSDGVTYTQVEGSLVSLVPGAQARAVGKANTVDGDKPIVRKGKLDVMQITINGIYTPTTNEVFDLLVDIWDTNGDVYVKWSYDDTGGVQRFTSSGKGFISSLTYPKVDAGDPNPVPFTAVLTIPGITLGTVPT